MNDPELKQAVLDALKNESSIFSADIRVSVDRGVVTLAGYVCTYSAKMKAQDVVTRLGAVRAVNLSIEIRPYRADPVMGEMGWSSLMD